MFEWFATAVASANAAKEISQSLMTLRDEEMIRSRVFDLTSSLMELQQQLMQAQLEQMELVKRIGELEQCLNTANTKQQKFARYRLHQFPEGASAFVLRDEYQAEEPKHYICSVCLESEQKVILQPRAMGLSCPKCNAFVFASSDDL